MRFKILLVLMASVMLSTAAWAQIDSLAIKKQAFFRVRAAKSQSGWEILSNLYQVAGDNLSGDDKSLTFKGTIYGIRSVFDPTLKNDVKFKKLWFQRHFEPAIVFGYKDNFKNTNLSVAFNLSIVNDNDAAESSLLNNNPQLTDKFKRDMELDEAIRKQITDSANDSLERIDLTASQKQAVLTNMRTKLKNLNDFEKSGDENVLNLDLKKMLERSGPKTFDGTTYESLEKYYSAKVLSKYVDTVVDKISRGWNVVLGGKTVYSFNKSAIQGYVFNVKAIKGIAWAAKTQLIMKVAYNIGDDTIVTTLNTKRRFLSDEIGLNWVLRQNAIKGAAGEKDTKTSAAEFSLTGGYNRIFNGLNKDEKPGQPTLSAKFGILIGKETWLTVPFTYNFERKESQALISLKVNIGEAPFSK